MGARGMGKRTLLGTQGASGRRVHRRNGAISSSRTSCAVTNLKSELGNLNDPRSRTAFTPLKTLGVTHDLEGIWVQSGHLTAFEFVGYDEMNRKLDRFPREGGLGLKFKLAPDDAGTPPVVRADRIVSAETFSIIYQKIRTTQRAST